MDKNRQKTGGRPKGGLNKATVAKLIDAQVAEKVAEIVNAPPQDGAMLQRYPARARAKDELAELIPVVKGHVGQFQQAAIAAGMPGTKTFNPSLWKMFKEWVELFHKVLDSAADFQDPRLKAQLWVPPPQEMPKPVEGKVVRLGNAVAASRVYQQTMQAPRQRALPPPAKRA